MRALTFFTFLSLWLPGLVSHDRTHGLSQPPHEQSTRPFRALVYNIHAGKDRDRADNLRRVADIILEHQADLVLLQEVDRGTERSGDVDQLAVLSRLTGYQGAFGRTLHYQGGEYGIAVLSRWPVAADTLIPLPVEPPQRQASGAYEPRGILHVLIDAPIGSIHPLNTHLDASPDDHFRRQEVDTLKRLMDRLGTSGTVLAGGDLNATPESAVVDRITVGEWRDAWEECGQGSGFTYPARHPVKRPDYLILPHTLHCDSAKVISSDASDHRPVLFILSHR